MAEPVPVTSVDEPFWKSKAFLTSVSGLVMGLVGAGSVHTYHTNKAPHVAAKESHVVTIKHELPAPSQPVKEAAVQPAEKKSAYLQQMERCWGYEGSLDKITQARGYAELYRMLAAKISNPDTTLKAANDWRDAQPAWKGGILPSVYSGAIAQEQMRRGIGYSFDPLTAADRAARKAFYEETASNLDQLK